MSRHLYLVAYDVACPKRLYRVYRFLLGYKIGGQKSFFECWLTDAELETIKYQLANLMNEQDDRIHILQLDPRQEIECFGYASTFNVTTSFIIV
jgi:CRISPR-associated protein Cas2